LACPDAELSILLTDGPGIRSLNRDFRGLDRATDVIAFAMREGPHADINPQLLGDVALSLDAASRRAKRRRVELLDCLTELLIHGILHLLGYEHVKDIAGGRRMRAKERALLALFD